MEIKFACLEALMTNIMAQVKSNVPILDKFKEWKYSPSFNLNVEQWNFCATRFLGPLVVDEMMLDILETTCIR